MDKIRLRGMIFTLVGATLWGLSGTNNEFLLKNYALSPIWLSSMRMLLAGISIFIFLFLKDRSKLMFIWKNSRAVVRLIIFSLFGMILNQLAYLYAINYTNAGTATVLQYMAPIIILILSCIIAKRYPRKRELWAIVLTIFGMFIVTTHGNPGNLIISTKGLAWGIISAITLCIYNILPVKLMKAYGDLVTISYSMIIGGIVLLVVNMSTNFINTGAVREGVEMDLIGWGAFLFVTFIGTLLSYVLYLKGVLMVGPVKASMLAAVEPVSATLFTVLLLGTSFTYIDILGFSMIISTIFILAKAK